MKIEHPTHIPLRSRALVLSFATTKNAQAGARKARSGGGSEGTNLRGWAAGRGLNSAIVSSLDRLCPPKFYYFALVRRWSKGRDRDAPEFFPRSRRSTLTRLCSNCQRLPTQRCTPILNSTTPHNTGLRVENNVLDFTSVRGQGSPSRAGASIRAPRNPFRSSISREPCWSVSSACVPWACIRIGIKQEGVAAWFP